LLIDLYDAINEIDIHNATGIFDKECFEGSAVFFEKIIFVPEISNEACAFSDSILHISSWTGAAVVKPFASITSSILIIVCGIYFSD